VAISLALAVISDQFCPFPCAAMTVSEDWTVE